MVVTARGRFTRDEYMLLPEGIRAELVDGSLVREPAPVSWHQSLVGRLHLSLATAVDFRRLVFSPIDLFVDPYNVLQPDLLVLAPEDGVRPRETEVPIPILVIEVLSPSTAKRDRDEKTPIYLRAGVREVWLVDPETETIEIHDRDGARRFGGGDQPRSAVVPGFAPRLPVLFGP